MGGESIVKDLGTGVVTTTAIEDGKTYVKTEQDVGAFIKNADKSRHVNRGFSDATNGIYKRATIPMEALNEWRVKYGFDWLNTDDVERRKWMKTEHFKKYELRRAR